MIKYYGKWILASLITPIVVAITQSTLGGLIHLFWPGSIMLLALGAEKNSTSQVVYVWGLAIGSNVLLYLVLGVIIHLMKLAINYEKPTT